MEIKVNDGFDFLLKRQVKTEDTLEKIVNLIQKNQCETLSHIDFFVKKSENLEHEVLAMGHRHDERLTALESEKL